MTERRAQAFYLGRRRYEPIHTLQRTLQEARARGLADDVILLLEHEPVVTLGRGAKREHVLFSEDVLRQMGVDLVETGRGGDVTFHGPGQLVGYPILDLKPDRCDLRKYVRGLEELMILIARDHDVEAGLCDGKIGIWVDTTRPTEWAGEAFSGSLAKIGAIGVRVSRWVTMHGFALNLDLDPASFAVIVPCGIREYPVSSIERVSGRAKPVRDVALSIGDHVRRALDYELEAVVDVSTARDAELLALVAPRAAGLAAALEARP
jgi:lipoyl(octanoyl) transferase